MRRAEPAPGSWPGETVFLVDTHVHLDQYDPAEARRLIRRASAAGVGRLLTVGVSWATSRQAIALARDYPTVLAAAGSHPRWLAGELRLIGDVVNGDPPGGESTIGDAAALETLLSRLDRLLVDAAALGEVGLDYGPDAATSSGAGGGHSPLADGPNTAPPEIQRMFLAGCLDLARRRDRAVVLHVVGGPDQPAGDAHADALALLHSRPVDHPSRPRIAVHYFVGDWPLAERYLEAGCWISVGKPVTRAANQALREAVARLPLDRLLIETDAYPLPGRTTEPRDVRDVAAAVAEIKGISPVEVGRATTAAFRRWLGTAAR